MLIFKKEASWGADPLEYVGGFRALVAGNNDTYFSSLGINGRVGWKTSGSIISTRTSSAVESILDLKFPEVDWQFLQSIYGWSAFQYQAWARGGLVIHGKSIRTVVLYTDNVLEFWVDGALYFGGDTYAYRKAPLVLRLSPGTHCIDLRLVRDVRAMGGVGPPDIRCTIRMETGSSGLVTLHEKLLLPETLKGYPMKSALASIPLRNNGLKWINVLDVESTAVRNLNIGYAAKHG